MPTKTGFKHTVTIDGTTSQRRSPRTYTHVVVGRWDYADEIRVVESNGNGYSARALRSDYEYLCKEIELGVGGTYRSTYANGSPCSWEVDQAAYDHAVASIGAAKSLDEYVANKKATHLASLHESNAKQAGKRGVLQWSQSAANATKAVGGFVRRGYTEVSVVAVEVRK